VKADVLRALVECVEADGTAVLVTDLESGDQALLFPLAEKEVGVTEQASGLLEVGPELRRAARAAALADTSRRVEVDGSERFLRVYNPSVRMIVVGAVHIAQPLATMATAAGFHVIVVDPRRAFATEERFPGVTLLRSWPAEALEELRPDHRTAVVTLTHDTKLDDPALVAALGSEAFYIGALGSRRTHGRRLERLGGEGFGEGDLKRIQGPVGLDIGARTPGEIAVAILADVVAALRGAVV
jgi:xanthine dehydrogenase accessory factor